MKFSRLKFYDTVGRHEAIIMFPNNHGARVVSEYRHHRRRPGEGSVEDDTYEVAVLVALKSRPRGTKDDIAITYETPITDDVLVNQTRDEVERILDEIAALPRRSFDDPRPRSITVYLTTYVPPEEDEEPEEPEAESEGNHPIVLDEHDRELGVTAADVAVDFIRDGGGHEPSSTSFHPGIWYSTGYETTDYSTGEEEERTFHLSGFTEDEEREIFGEIMRRRR